MADIGTSDKRRGRPPGPDSDLIPADRMPLGTRGVGRVFRSARLTSLGWAHVSSEVQARIAVKTMEASR